MDDRGNALREQIQHITWYAKHYGIDINEASIAWVNRYGKVFRNQFEHRCGDQKL